MKTAFRAPDLPFEGIQTLSPRELKVFRGMGSANIAAELGISHKTVEAHRKTIKEKLGGTTALEAMHTSIHEPSLLLAGRVGSRNERGSLM